MIKTSCEGKDLQWLTPPWWEAKTRTHSRTVEGGNEAETMKEASLPRDGSRPIICQGWFSAYSGLGPPSSINYQESVPQTCVQTILIEKNNLQLKFFPGVSSWQENEEETHFGQRMNEQDNVMLCCKEMGTLRDNEKKTSLTVVCVCVYACIWVSFSWCFWNSLINVSNHVLLLLSRN